jgi:hypothetical protein
MGYAETMSDSTSYVTIFRSTDESADNDAWGVTELLCAQGFHAEAVEANGGWEVRVPAAEGSEAAKAAENISFHDIDEDALDEEPEDPSHDMDLVTVAHTDGAMGEMEATTIEAILDANGIQALVVGDSILPNLGFEVRVPREDRPKAEAAIAEAQAAGPAAAAQGEAESEKQ